MVITFCLSTSTGPDCGLANPGELRVPRGEAVFGLSKTLHHK